MKTRKAVASGLAALLAAATLAAVATRPTIDGRPGSGSDDAAASDFLPCIVSDAGGFDDKSFNQLGFEGASRPPTSSASSSRRSSPTARTTTPPTSRAWSPRAATPS